MVELHFQSIDWQTLNKNRTTFVYNYEIRAFFYEFMRHPSSIVNEQNKKKNSRAKTKKKCFTHASCECMAHDVPQK